VLTSPQGLYLTVWVAEKERDILCNRFGNFHSADGRAVADRSWGHVGVHVVGTENLKHIAEVVSGVLNYKNR